MSERETQGPAPLDELRLAEAARVLGLLDVVALPSLADEWILRGFEDDSVRALAAAGQAEPALTAKELGVLLARLAADNGIRFGGLQEARAVYAESLVGSIGRADFGAQVFGLSNTVTDEWMGRLRRWFGRLGRGESRS